MPTKKLSVACRHASTYKGIRPPKCGCVVCRIIWRMEENHRYAKLELAKLHAASEFPF